MSTLYMSLSTEEQKSLIRKEVAEAEIPVAGWEGMRDIRRHSAPSPKKIRDYWEDTLISLDLFDSRFELDEPICWAHGGAVPSLERAHILSWQQGGSWEPSNFHLLCHFCHKVSEALYGEEYWEWFLKVNESNIHRMITLWKFHPNSTLSESAQFSKNIWDKCPEDIREEAMNFLNSRKPYGWANNWRQWAGSDRVLDGSRSALHMISHYALA